MNHAEQKYLGRAVKRTFTRDAMMTYDQMTVDSTGAFLIGQLERLDLTLNEPLVEFTWSRDVSIRTDVSPADEVASFTNSAFSSPGGVTSTGINWLTN